MTAPEGQSCQQATLRPRILSDLLFFDRKEHLQRFVLLAQGTSQAVLSHRARADAEPRDGRQRSVPTAVKRRAARGAAGNWVDHYGVTRPTAS